MQGFDSGAGGASSTGSFPTVPLAARLALAAVPPMIAGAMLQALTSRLAQRHGDILRRMGDHADRHVLIDLTDLPHLLLLHPRAQRLSAHARSAPPAHDLRLAGSLAAFLAMMHGAADGDALFFSRQLTLEGDTAAALALRNAMDDAEIDLAGELAALGGPFALLARPSIACAERLTGLALQRVDMEREAW